MGDSSVTVAVLVLLTACVSLITSVVILVGAIVFGSHLARRN